MQLSISGHHVEVSEALRNYVGEKMARLDRHSDRVMEVHVILTVEKLSHKAEATVHVNGANIYAEDIQEDMYAAIDGLIDKLDRQVLKHKEKLTDHH